MNKHLSLVLLVPLAALSTFAAAQTSYIPASAHVMGYGGTIWRTDIEIKSCDDLPAVVRLEALQRDAVNLSPPSEDIEVEAGKAVRIDDALMSLFRIIGAAAFRVTTVSGCSFVTSRTFNDAENGTYGQYVPAIPESDAFDNIRAAQLMQLSQSNDDETGYRTAIGLLNLTGSNLRLSLRLYSSTGKFFGPLTQNLGPYQYVQLDKVYKAVTFLDVPDGYVTITTFTPGGRFLAYASVVDNRSGDAIFIPAQGVVPETEDQEVE